jgi:hypothetical protein
LVDVTIGGARFASPARAKKENTTVVQEGRLETGKGSSSGFYPGGAFS